MRKVALITGTGGGIGKAVAEHLLREGYDVFGYSRKNTIQHSNFCFIRIDLRDLQKVKKLELPTIKDKHVILINNAAVIGDIMPLRLKKEQSIIDEYNLNIITPTLLCNKFINSYLDSEKLIINIGSGAANTAIASWSTYSSSKSALDMLSRVLSEEKHKNLHVFSVHPGIVNTNMQNTIRNSQLTNFPKLQEFIDYHQKNELEQVSVVAHKLYYIIQNFKKFSKNILSIRDIDIK